MRGAKLLDLKLSQKLPAVIIGLSVTAAVITTGLGFFGASDALNQQIEKNLESVAADRALEVGEQKVGFLRSLRDGLTRADLGCDGPAST